MKLKIFSLLVVLGAMSVIPLIYMGKFDPMSFNPMSLIDSIKNSSIADVKNINVKVPESIQKKATNEKVQVYKWVDEHGVMQFSGTPPPDAGNTQRIEINPNHNIIQAVKIPVEEEVEEEVEEKPRPAVKAPSPYSPSGMKQAVDDAKGIEDMLKKRHEDQQKMMRDL